MLSIRPPMLERPVLNGAARIYQRLLELGFALLPLLGVAYLIWSGSGEQKLEALGLHGLVIAVATVQGSFIAWVAWRCFVHGGDPFLRWLALGFAGFTLIYLPHGLFTPLARDHAALFLLYGPISRLVLAGCLTAAVFRFATPPLAVEQRSARPFWPRWIGAFLLINGAAAWLAHTPWGQAIYLRLALEAAALGLSLFALAAMSQQAGRSPLMTLFASALANFAQASLAFLLASPWNHLWWLGHVIFAIGFLVLSYGVLRAYFTSHSFDLVFSQDELFERLYESNAALTRALAHAQDANSELEQRNRELQAARRDFQSLFAMAPDGVLVVNDQGRILDANSKTLALFGASEAEMLGLSVEDLIPENQRANHIDYRHAFHQHPERFNPTPRPILTARRLDGSEFYCAISLSPLNFHGQACTMAIVRDITAAHLAEERLRLSQQRFRELFDHGPIGMALLRPDGQWLELNDALCRLLAYDRSELLATRLDNLTHPEDRNNDVALHRELAAGERDHYQIEKRFLRADGVVIWGIVTSSLLKEEDGQTLNFVAQIEDITDRRHLELEREEHADNMARLSRRLVEVQEEERRRLAATVHDLVSPNLAAVKINLGMVESLLSDETAEARARLEDTQALLTDTVSSIRGLTTDLRPVVLDFAGLWPAVDSYAQQFSARTGIAVTLSGEAQARLPADQESLLFRIVQEAMTNCAKHAQAQNISIELHHDAAHARLSISDDGKGFEPDPARPPSGLGLLTMRERAEFAGGSFSLESQPGRGTRISVVF